MSAAPEQHSSYAQQTSPRRRIVAVIAALAAEAALILLLLWITPPYRPPPAGGGRATFTLLAAGRAQAVDATRAKAQHAAQGAVHRPATHAAASAVTPPAPTNMPLNMITLSHEEYAASDIAKLPSHSEEHGQQSADAGGAGSGSDSAFAAGQGPNGEPLYQVEWYRRPTQAELQTYLPQDNPGSGWGLIACQTIERFHVDNCRELGDSPAGSGYARAVREAAWQFLVRPPRLGGKSLIGVWVGIRIEYSERSASAR